MTLLQEYRIKNNYSINKISTILGISIDSYISIENNPLLATPSIAGKISKMLNKSIKDIFLI